MADTAQWLETDFVDGPKLPSWQRRAAVLGGRVFIPAAVAGNEKAAFLCACFDGVSAVIGPGGHLYLPVDWLAREYPEIAETCDVIERRMLEAVALLEVETAGGS